MPIAQGKMTFSIGRDCTVVVVHPLAPGGRVEMANVTGFTVSPEYTSVSSNLLDGNTLYAELPRGYTFSIDLDREGPGIDDLMVLVEAAWRSAGILYSASVFQYVTEPNGAVSTYQFTECSLQFADLGSWKADSVVSQKISGRANRRVKV